jgi:hypothetical protein
MIFGLTALVFGYALFYWGYHHFPGQQRYSLWSLLGFGNLFGASSAMPAGQPIQFNS